MTSLFLSHIWDHLRNIEAFESLVMNNDIPSLEQDCSLSLKYINCVNEKQFISYVCHSFSTDPKTKIIITNKSRYFPVKVGLCRDKPSPWPRFYFVSTLKINQKTARKPSLVFVQNQLEDTLQNITLIWFDISYWP